MHAEENVANMLPIVPVTGSTLTKNENIDDADKENFSKDSDVEEMIKKLNNAIEKNDNIAIENAITDLAELPEYEEIMTESVFKDENDIFYNKVKFENGDTNLLFIVGYSGGGKSTISGEQKKVLREVVDMDRIVLNMSKSDDYFKNISNFAYKFITGPGKKYRCEGKATEELLKKMDVVSYRPKISKELFEFAEKYASSHKTTKLIMEGVWIYRYIEPSEAKSYAVYIKGTSLKTATERALKRDRQLGTDGKNAVSRSLHTLGKYILASGDALTKSLSKWQKYYKEKYEAQNEVGSIKVSKSITNKVKDVSRDIKHGVIKDDMKIIKDSIKDSYKYSKAQAKKAKKQIMKECVLEYVIDDNITDIDSYIEESIKDEIINFTTKVDISRKIRVISIEIAIMKFKLKLIDSDNKGKINDLKRSIIKKEKEKRKLSADLNPEAKAELKRLEKEAEKLAEKEFEEIEKEMDSENKDNDDKKKETKNDKAVNESFQIIDETITLEKSDEKDDKKENKTMSPELKRIDEVLGDISKYEYELKIAKEKLDITGDVLYEKKIKGLTAKLETLKEKKEKLEKEIKKEEKIISEAANMEDEIKPIVNKLNSLGYKVKYASPGHEKLRKKEDFEPDGVYYGRLYSDARIMFDKKYKLPDAPKYWYLRDVDGCSYLDISPLKYNDSDGTPDEAFKKWKDNYMQSLKEYVDSLDNDKTKKLESEEETTEMTIESIMSDAFDKFDMEIDVPETNRYKSFEKYIDGLLK